MLIVATGPATSALARLGESAPQPQLWMAQDFYPANGADALRDQPWTALAALSERMAHTDDGAVLSISALEGFGSAPERKVRADDHTKESSALSQRLVTGQWRRPTFDYASMIVATLSGIYDDACSRMLTASPGSDRSLDAARQIAASAVAHFAWNCSRLPIPVLMLGWDAERTVKGKVVGEAPHLPRRLLAMADVTLRVERDAVTVADARPHTGLTPGSDFDWSLIEEHAWEPETATTR